MDWTNKLYFGDNLRILREHVAAESVDLIYLDPPFNSSANYNVLFKESDQAKTQFAGDPYVAHIAMYGVITTPQASLFERDDRPNPSSSCEYIPNY